VVTVGRSDYSILLPVLRQIEADPELHLHLIVAGMHLSPEFGLTVRVIEQDGFEINERIDMLLSSDTPEGIAKSMGLGTIGFSQAYARFQPDVLLVMGDRFETHSAVAAALAFNIPIAHIHGGESTEGLIDESLRHSITKMSHLHFVANETYARRVIQMGEEPWRVVISGAPALDNIRDDRLLAREDLQAQTGLDLRNPFLLVTYHPVTLEFEETDTQVEELLAALEEADLRIIITYPNADTRSRSIIEKILKFVGHCDRAQVAVNLGTVEYLSVMQHADVMVGNSSSGIIEAASFKLPVVNVGTRQRGRLHGPNVIDVGYSRKEILEAIKKASSGEFRARLANLVNPYGDGNSATRIVKKLKSIETGRQLLMKRFYDVGMMADAHRVCGHS